MKQPYQPSPQANSTHQALYAARVTRRLSEGMDELPYDITERLRAARMQALARRKPACVQTATVASSAGAGTLVLGGGHGRRGGFSWWQSMASALPLIALVAGLVAINIIQDDDLASELAEVDAALLTDDLPPDAYADPGFVQFLKTSHSSEAR
jgi:hypothetical protein